VFPDHNWERWRFHSLPRSFWETVTPDEALALVQDLEKRLEIKTKEDWYRVSASSIREVGSKIPYSEGGIQGLPKLLMTVYADHKVRDFTHFLMP
jgi:hypothetical protein